jgi:hypothetical protein
MSTPPSIQKTHSTAAQLLKECSSLYFQETGLLICHKHQSHVKIIYRYHWYLHRSCAWGRGGHVTRSACASHDIWIVLRNHLSDTKDWGCPSIHKNYTESQPVAYNRSCKILRGAHFSSVHSRQVSHKSVNIQLVPSISEFSAEQRSESWASHCSFRQCSPLVSSVQNREVSHESVIVQLGNAVH